MKIIYKVMSTLMIVFLLASCGGKEERMAKYLEKGKDYFDEKNLDKARIEFKNVLQIDPKHSDAYFYLGKVEEKNSEIAKAVANYKKAIELNADNIEAKVALARIYVIVGSNDFVSDAKKLISEVLSKNPAHSEANVALATIEYKSGDKSKASEMLKDVISKDSSQVEGILLLASMYSRSNNNAESISVLTEGIKNNSKDIGLKVALSKLLFNEKKYDQAEKLLNDVIDIGNDEFKHRAALAAFYVAIDETDKAGQVLRNAIKDDDEDVQRYLALVQFVARTQGKEDAEKELLAAIDQKPDLYDLKFTLSRLYLETGDVDSSMNVLKKIVESDKYGKNAVRAKIFLASMLFDMKKYDDARPYVRSVLDENPNDNQAVLINSKLALVDKDSVTAINGLRTVLKNQPKNTDAAYFLSNAHEMNNESQLAESVLKKSIESNPLDYKTHLNYANYLAHKNRRDESLTVIDKALVYFKDSYDLLALKLRLLSDQGDDAAVAETINYMKRELPDNIDVAIKQAQYYLTKNMNSEAIDILEKTLAKEGKRYDILEMLTGAYMKDKRTDQAVSMLRSRLEANPRDSVSQYLLGRINFDLKKNNDARDFYTKSIEINPKWDKPYLAMALTFLSEKNINGAVEVYKKALAGNVASLDIQLRLAGLYERSRDFENAKEIYRNILVDNPYYVLAINNLVSLVIDYGSEEEIGSVTDLVAKLKNNNQAVFQDTVAWYYAKTGDFATAINILVPIVETNPNIAVFNYHLGFSLYKSGDVAKAKRYLSSAVSNDQVYPGKDTAKKILGGL